MSDSIQQWILKQSIKAKKVYENTEDNLGTYTILKPYIWDFDPDDFEDLFELLDIPAIEKQLEQLLAPFIFMSSQEGYYGLEDNELFEKLNSEDDTKVIVAEVLAVFGLENKETQQ